MTKKVLIITYYWPPAGGVAVIRWVKLSKYLAGNGWEPIIYTVRKGNFPLHDASLEKDVLPNLSIIKRPIWEPFRFYRLLFEKKNNSEKLSDITWKDKASRIQLIANWIRGNVFIPDARAFWIRPSINFLKTYLNHNPVDAIISTGPPHSAHLIALGLKKRMSIPWLADFRDPWTSMDYYKELLLTPWADKRHHQMESEVLRMADAISVVGLGMKYEFESKHKREVILVTNGFDEDDFSQEKVDIPHEFSIVHIGSIYERLNPLGLWDALSELNNEGHPLRLRLKIKLIGRLDPHVIQTVENAGLAKFLTVIPFQPHDQAIAQMRISQILLLCVYEKTPWVLTGKLFEYFAAQRPILCIGSPAGDAARAIRETGVGSTFANSDVKGIKTHLIAMYRQFEERQLILKDSSVQLYSHRHLAAQIAGILNKITQIH